MCLWFFAEEGVNVRIVDKYPSGKRTLQGLLDGEVTVAPTAEAPIVFRSFERGDFAIVATIGSSDNEPKIIARKDSGIEKPEDLRGIRQTLANFAQLMEKEYDEELKTILPDEALLVRADRFTPFHYVQQVMTLCGEKGIQIWKVELAAATLDEAKGAE